MKPLKKVTLLMASCLMMSSMVWAQSEMKTVIVIFDGLRPDYITPQLMPRLYQLKQQAGYANNNHSVFPTVTRVNSASYATGSYPARHGILGNSIHVPTLGNTEIYDTGSMADLLAVDSLSGHRLLTATSAGELLAENGKQLYAFSSGTSGQAFLQNPQIKGAIIHPGFVLPKSLEPKVKAAIGEVKSQQGNGYAKHMWITDAFIHFGLATDGPEVSSIWYSEPDATQHATGIGSPRSLEAVKVMDAQLGRILDTLEQRNLTGQVNLIVTSDHGFITYEGDQTLRDFLIEEKLKSDVQSDDIIVADGAIFVKNRDAAVIADIVAKLQEQPWVGPLFTAAKAPGMPEGIVAGTLSFDIIHWNHPDRAADILVAYAWDDKVNEYGYQGVQHSKSSIAAGHGGISKHEIRTPMVLFGPAFKAGYVSELPSSFIDIMPTVLALHGIGRAGQMDGRVLSEFFADERGGATPKVKIETVKSNAAGTWGSYEVEAQLSTIDGHRYLDFGRTRRTGPQ
ncbi:alkaline phosphatase family protein [Parapedobacter sp. ISTM3]|uniref:alkaline phosphatase family protein n=1 Tax=Parapedobacter sp. ISTM3 TaxID=2800130 RepID=UPI001904C39A|nr:nucleotide pyrophosphatase/phosphodiesterase family protein [Parapedobacter sp. ISTM3]MBK1438872.1 alkaline phosphatase family protein [Parapedobacter sp. ISTM3]